MKLFAVKPRDITRLILPLSVVLLAGCRLVITTDYKGRIISESGDFDCAAPSCAFEINETVTETFTAVPAEGYRFIEWTGQCVSTPVPVCETAVAPLGEEFAQYDGDVGLSAVFESTSTVRTWYRDKDGDHYGFVGQRKRSAEQPEGFVASRTDCNDFDAEIHPWAREVHDGEDNNCNDRIDEGFVKIPFYLDEDGDGYGNPDIVTMRKRRPAGHTRNNRDCNDASADDYPGAPEQYDNRDNDCDGAIDEGGNTYYRDVDGDGYGDASDTLTSFEPMPGYVETAEDCDDSNPDVNPTAEETFDSTDNDCDGQIDEGFSSRTYYLDTDGDGYGDRSESIVDITRPEGYATNGDDNCIDVANPSQGDIDRDGIGDACDDFTDSDRDGEQDSADNCPDVYNPDQRDIDGDGTGDSCDDTDDREPEPGSEPESVPGGCSLTAEELAMLEAVNAFRAEPRLCGASDYPAAEPLTWNCSLESAALKHSVDMASNDFVDHTGSDGSTFITRVNDTGYAWSTLGENIAAGYSSVDSVMAGWIESPGHCGNLMNPNFSNLGSAKYSNPSSRYGVYWTQVFGRPR